MYYKLLIVIYNHFLPHPLCYYSHTFYFYVINPRTSEMRLILKSTFLGISLLTPRMPSWDKSHLTSIPQESFEHYYTLRSPGSASNWGFYYHPVLINNVIHPAAQIKLGSEPWSLDPLTSNLLPPNCFSNTFASIHFHKRYFI